MHYHFEFGGELGDVLYEVFRTGVIGLLNGMEPSDTASILLVCHNPFAAEIFSFHPKAAQVRLEGRARTRRHGVIHRSRRGRSRPVRTTLRRPRFLPETRPRLAGTRDKAQGHARRSSAPLCALGGTGRLKGCLGWVENRDDARSATRETKNRGGRGERGGEKSSSEVESKELYGRSFFSSPMLRALSDLRSSSRRVVAVNTPLLPRIQSNHLCRDGVKAGTAL